MRASRFINDINLDTKNKKYNPLEVFIELDKSDVSDLLDFKEPPDIYTVLVC